MTEQIRHFLFHILLSGLSLGVIRIGLLRSLTVRSLLGLSLIVCGRFGLSLIVGL